MLRKRVGPWPLATLATAAALAIAGCATAPRSPAASTIDLKATPDGVLLLEDGAPILLYRSYPEPGREPWRMHYIHPVYTGSGTVLTEDGPVDHTHQRGIFWAWRRILIDGVVVADSWVGRQFELQAASPESTRHADGSAEIRRTLRWIVPLDGSPTAVVEESSAIRTFPLRSGVRRIDIDVRLKALRPGVAVAGSDDEKGYGGLSFRLRDAPALGISSEGRALRATVARMETGAAVSFTWDPSSELSETALSIECRAGERPWTEWVLRQEPSMQNCAFPGRAPLLLPADRSVHLAATINLR